MAGNFKAIVREIEIALADKYKVTVITAAGPIKLGHGSAHDLDDNLLTGADIRGRSVLVHGSAMLAVWIDEPE